MTTTIEWTDKTWNPVTGCTKVSAGCKNCYAEAIADRFFAKQYPPNPDGSPRKFTDVRCHPDRLMQPLRWKDPANCFVNSMSDLFHEDVPDQFITDILGVMFLAHWVRFQILTKRPARMLAYFAKGDHGIFEQFIRIRDQGGMAPREVFRALDLKHRDGHFIGQWPLPNVWLGVSVENQIQAHQRIPLLLATPAAVRFLSVEPMLEAIDLTAIKRTHAEGFMRPLDGRFRTINWVICGGESGPDARPFNLAWAESLLDQCKAAGVPFFMKQIGSNPEWPNEYWKGLLPPKRENMKGGDPAEWPDKLRVRECFSGAAISARSAGKSGVFRPRWSGTFPSIAPAKARCTCSGEKRNSASAWTPTP